MAIVNEGLYKVELFQEYDGDLCLNTFYYLSNDGLDDGQEELATLFDNDIVANLADVQNTLVSYTNIRVTPVFGTGVEENRVPSTTVGTVSGSALPPFVAFSYRLLRTTNELRSGWKRFVGLVEENMGYLSFGGTWLATANAFGASLAANLVGTTDFYRLVITRRPFSTKAMNDYWEAIDVGDVVLVNRPTTQNSRKAF